MVDVSGSTLADDVAPTRLQAIKQAAMGLLDQVPADRRVGPGSLANEAEILVRPTTDRDLVRQGIAGAAIQRRDGHRRRPPTGPRRRPGQHAGRPGRSTRPSSAAAASSRCWTTVDTQAIAPVPFRSGSHSPTPATQWTSGWEFARTAWARPSR